MAEKKKKKPPKYRQLCFLMTKMKIRNYNLWSSHIDWTSSLINIFVCARKESKAAAYKQWFYNLKVGRDKSSMATLLSSTEKNGGGCHLCPSSHTHLVNRGVIKTLSFSAPYVILNRCSPRRPVINRSGNGIN